MKLRKFAQISTSEEEEEEEEEMSNELEEGEILPPEEGEILPPEEGEDEEASQEDPKPVGKRVRFSGEGSEKKSHYKVFEFSGNRYTIEDPVLLAPETKEQKPDIVIIKDITQTIDGMVMVTGQLFYHPEDAKKKGGGNWQTSDTRELFYSTHRVEVPAKCVMHKCVVHFIPANMPLPDCRKHPGFIIRQIYDAAEQKLWKITKKDLH
ncbi:hypothetical protein NC652_008282 [Populus alba x Populus x berolinensis]|uniref:BAH domain-containing protein n=2 Tax=Populus TaxID=3689 RepID=A0A4U5PVY2_POPAL|nr:uncharacterized protein LOC118028472 [Populus alba]KAJ6942409.1 hypothetical protein NC652_008282 [Populus alba x Populus x berolinensis]KAJ7004075.1 hypothetical protein NC653_009076 [Populus alba x Populus x berolinensis]TKS01022.1 uncharacterized protein D5086_0000175050 [Populus alba]